MDKLSIEDVNSVAIEALYELREEDLVLMDDDDVFHVCDLVDHKVFPDEGTHMLTTKVTPKFSIMSADMRSLLKLGLSRVQSNTPGTLSFYFEGYPGKPQAPDA